MDNQSDPQTVKRTPIGEGKRNRHDEWPAGRAGVLDLELIIAALSNDGRFLYAPMLRGVIFWDSDTDAAQFVNRYKRLVSLGGHLPVHRSEYLPSPRRALLNNGEKLTTARVGRFPSQMVGSRTALQMAMRSIFIGLIISESALAAFNS